MTNDNNLIVYQDNLPSLPTQASCRLEVEFSRQILRVLATGEIGMAGMSEMSEVERHAQWKLVTTAAAADLLAKGAAATRCMSPAERQAQQALFEDYALRMTQLAEITNISIIREVDHAISELGKRTFADVLEDFDARLTDALSGRHSQPSLPSGRR